jgi:hypothetical protein
MLTGSGVALILRVPSTPPGDHWTTHKWYVFAGVAALSLATKYVIRYRGSHVFNPSNIGLVVTFVVFHEGQVEPLDFWWAPLTAGMLAAYAVILVGGLLITARLHLLGAAAAFWIVLAAGIGVLAASGHCMVARWAFAPVCGFDYWRVIVTSPEILIFLFFMITDPKTLPADGRGRLAFGASVAVASTLLMAPQTNEYWTKVALLGGLAVICAARPLLDRLTAATKSEDGRASRRRVTQAGLVVVLAGVVPVAIVAAGSPARDASTADFPELSERSIADIDPATFPSITVDQDVVDWNHEIDGAGARAIVLTLVENLRIETEALLQGTPSVLEAVDHGDRLDEMRERLDTSLDTGRTVVEHYRIDDVKVTLLVPFGKQDGLSLGLEATGTVTEETYGADGQLEHRSSAPLATTFALRRATGGRWLNVGVFSTVDG